MSTLDGVAPITISQFIAFRPPARFRDELIAGEIVLSPDSKANHQEIAYRLHRLLDDLLRSSDFLARERTNVELPGLDSMPSPDLFVMDSKRWEIAVQSRGYPQGAPQLAIEIVSPSNRKGRVLKKVALYLAAGSVEVWVVYPKRKAVEVYAKGEQPRKENGLLELPGPLPDGSLDLGKLFDL